MGNCVSFQLSCDQTVNRIIRCLCGKGYIRNVKRNLKALQREMEDLRANQVEVKNKVAREERLHRQRRPTVEVWLTRVEDIDTRVSDVLNTSPAQIQKLCLCGLCSKNVCSSYKYGKSVFLLLEEVKKLRSDGHFEEVAEPALRSEVEEMATRPTIGQEEILGKAWKRLMEDGVGIMGLHGMGGVGKTTLFKKIHNKFAETAGWFVIFVEVSRGAEIPKLQEDIAKKLHLNDEGWRNKTESDKATDIHMFLKGKRFVLMLDNIWEYVNLEAIGVPFPTKENGCKIAFTTRSREVCGRMGDHEPMQVNCLGQDKSWELFVSKVGDKILGSDAIIVELARKVAEKCCGLPLALDLIGGTMASNNNVQDWQNTFRVLTSSAAEFPDMENGILPILKVSYDCLENEHIKSCFLYCALFPESSVIYPEKLIDCWICEGFIGEEQDVKGAQIKGFAVLGTLFRANLLTKVGRRMAFKVHDVVREMALWIASETFVVHAKVGLHEIPKVKDWGAVRRMSLMDNKIKELTCDSKCPELTTLLLQDNDLKNVSGEFIQSMQKLVVLDLSNNQDLNELPEQISELASLQYLDLSWTSIEQLPVGISKMSSLRILKLLYSNVHGDASVLKELKPLEHLQVLTLTISMELGLEQILGDQRLANYIYDLEIRDFQQKPLNISLLVSMENLRSLWLVSCPVLEMNTNMKCRESELDSSVLHDLTSPCFTNLQKVQIFYCKSTKDLTWLLFAPNLVILYISNAGQVEEIINKEKATNLTRITPFQKLEFLTLRYLPKLESTYWSPLPFPFLRSIHVIECPKLRTLPLNATSVPQIGQFRILMYPREHVTKLEWEDEGTKNRFLPSIHEGWSI